MIRNDNLRGAFYMSVSMAGFVLNDAIVKLASAELGLFQIIFLRGIICSILLGIVIYIKCARFSGLPFRDWKILSVRMFGELGATICFLMALFNMPLANATAILQALPLAVTLGAAIFLGEKVGWRRYAAIAVGFAGILIIVRPGSEGFNEYSLWAVAAVIFIVLRDLSTRRLSAQTPSLIVAQLASVGITLTGGGLLPFQDWQPVSSHSWHLLGASAVFLVIAYIFGVMAMRVGEISFISPFRYTILLWAILLGFFVFGDLPDRWTLIGSAFIIGMGCYSFYRENLQRKKHFSSR